jgi:hypothetical protein
MKKKSETPEKNKIIFKIEVDAADFHKAMHLIEKRIAKLDSHLAHSLMKVRQMNASERLDSPYV